LTVPALFSGGVELDATNCVSFAEKFPFVRAEGKRFFAPADGDHRQVLRAA
jgi:hypothetical protein